MAKSVTPKGCSVNSVKLTRGGADISLSCSRGAGSFQHDYVHKKLKGITSVRLNGASVSGDGARVGFVVVPRHAKCSRSGSTLDCKILGSK